MSDQVEVDSAGDAGAPVAEEAPELKPTTTPLMNQPASFESVPVSSSDEVPSSVSASSGGSMFSVGVALVTVVACGMLWRACSRFAAQHKAALASLEGRFAALEARVGAVETRELPTVAIEAVPAAAPESGSPVPVPSFDHEALQGRVDELERVVARIRKKAPPKRAPASKE